MSNFKLGKHMNLPGEGSSSGKVTRGETRTNVVPADGYEPSLQESS